MNVRAGDTQGRLGQVALALPGIVALALGALYGLGALLTMADLRGEGVNVRDAVPLIPLEQLLSRGIGTSVSAGVAFGVLVAFALVSEMYQRSPNSTPQERLLWLMQFVIIMLSLAVALVALPLILALAVIAAFGGLFAAEFLPTTFRQDTVVACAIVVVGLALHAFFAPPPLAEVTLQLEGRPPVSGPLVAASGDRWYVAARGEKRIVSLPDGAVRRADIVSGSRSRTLRRHVTDALGIPTAAVWALVGALAVTIFLVTWRGQLAQWTQWSGLLRRSPKARQSGGGGG